MRLHGSLSLSNCLFNSLNPVAIPFLTACCSRMSRCRAGTSREAVQQAIIWLVGLLICRSADWSVWKSTVAESERLIGSTNEINKSRIKIKWNILIESIFWIFFSKIFDFIKWSIDYMFSRQLKIFYNWDFLKIIVESLSIWIFRYSVINFFCEWFDFCIPANMFANIVWLQPCSQ